VVWVEKDQRAVTVLEPVSADMNMVSETLARSRGVVAEAIVIHARACELVAKARRHIEDHRYLLIWALPSGELVSERSSYLRLGDAAIRDFARYRRP
jgi:hypothetical protein